MPEQVAIDHDVLTTMVQKISDMSIGVAELRKVVVDTLMPAITDISKQEAKCITNVQSQLDYAGRVSVDFGAKINHAFERIKDIECAQQEADKKACAIRQDFDHAMGNLKIGWGVLTVAMIPVLSAAVKALLGI